MIGSPAEEIKSRLDIVEFIQTYVRLYKAGMNFKAPCPFHGEKTPSFFVSPTRQIWHCFGGCGEGGDIFKFVMKIEGLDFPEALRLLAARAGVVLQREDPALRGERSRSHEICEHAAKIFEKNLLLSSAPKEYLKKRGMTEETVRGFRIGWAPESWDFLLSRLVKRGFKKEEVEKAGLAVRHEDGTSWYDRFRSRIIFPINDVNARVIGFGGRIFEATKDKKQETGKTEAKYINTPQTLIYDKSRVLYGFDKAKQEIRGQGAAVIVEGYMDCVMSHQAGVKNTIAVSGTALTPQQLKTIKRLCDTVVCSFDTDTAGENATRRSLSLAAEYEFERRIAAIPSGKDPADAVLENPAEWLAAVADAKPVLDFYFEKTFREENPERAEGKKKISAILMPLISEVRDEIQKAHWVRELAKRFAMSEDAIWKELSRRPGDISRAPANRGQSADSGVAAVPSRRELLEDRFLSLLAIMPEETRARVASDHHLEFIAATHQELFPLLIAGSSELPEHLRDKAESLRFKGEFVRESGRDIGEELALCGRELEKECVRTWLSRLGEEIRVCERTGDESAIQPLLENFRTLSEQLKILS